MTWSIVIIAGLSFIGFGLQPPAPNWGLMLNENRIGLVSNPWGVAAPAHPDRSPHHRPQHLHRRRGPRLHRRGAAGRRGGVPPGAPHRPAARLGGLMPGSPRIVVQGLRVVLAGSAVDVVDASTSPWTRGRWWGSSASPGRARRRSRSRCSATAAAVSSVAAGTVELEGRDVLTLERRSCGACAGCRVAYVPQDPASALNPSLKVGYQLREALTVHAGDDPGLPAADGAHGAGARPRSTSPPARRSSTAYPHQLSGGQQQRIALAMAFSCRPELIVLDEPTTGLDVATQRHVLDTVRGLCSSYGVAALYVTHDLAVVAEIADRVAVMYSGQLIELGHHEGRLRLPGHPYTDGLLRAIPSPEICHVLEGMEGQPPSPGGGPPAASSSRAALTPSPSARPPAADGRVNGGGARGALHPRRRSWCASPRASRSWPPTASRLVGSGRGRAAPGGRRPGRVLRRRAVLFDVALTVPRTLLRGRRGRVGLGQDHAGPLRHRPARQLDGQVR